MRKREPMVPFSVIERMHEIHYQHLQEITKLVGDHLVRVAELYERALNPPVSTPQEFGKAWVSEEEEDDEYLALRAEARAAEEIAREAGFDSGDISFN